MGKTLTLLNTDGHIRKHPHAHGEDLQIGGAGIDNRETPPRSWGRHNVHKYIKTISRNTPTLMGKTMNEICWHFL